MRAPALLCLFLTTCNAIDVILKIDHHAVRSIDTTKFLSFTLDTSFVRGNFCGINWLKAILLARSLTPCYVRVGGDDSDFMIFEDSAHVRRSDALPDAPKPTPDANGCGMFERDFFNMTRNQFDRINWFVQAAGLKLMFDLNAVYERQNGTAWNPMNTVKLLNYAQEMEYAMDFELGNEPEDYPGWYNFTINGKEMTSNYQ
uniref:Uncharacterized protein n=1 Tax=Plectus sambesii TaxID=2011161 RepID=A0A914UPC5_9BILA